MSRKVKRWIVPLLEMAGIVVCVIVLMWVWAK